MVREGIPQTRGAWNKGVKGSRGSGEGNYYIKGISIHRYGCSVAAQES